MNVPNPATAATLPERERQFHSLYDHMNEGYAHCRMLPEPGAPQGFVFLEVNQAFERLTGLKGVIGRRATEVIPGLGAGDSELFLTFGRVAVSGRSEKFELYADSLAMWLAVTVYSPQPGDFVAVLDDITERKTAVEALRASEAKLRLVVEHSSQLFYAHDTDHVLSYVSPQARDFFDCEPEEAMHRWTEFLTDHPLNAEGLALTQAAIATGKRQCPYQLELKTKRGRIIWVEVRESPVVVEGRTVAIVGALTDITSSRYARELLLLHSAAMQATSNMVVITDARGKIQWVNPAFCRVTGYGASEVIGKNPRLLKSGAQPKAFYEEMWGTILAGKNWSGEFVNRRKDGSHYTETSTIAPVPGPGGGIAHFVAIKQEITELKRTQETLATERNLLRTLFDLLPDFIYVKDEQSRFVACNERCARSLGAPDSQALLGKTDADFLPPLLAARLRTEELGVLAGRPIIDREESFLLADGVQHFLLTNKYPLRDSLGKIVGLVGSGRDITDRKILEQKSLRAQRLEAIGTLAAGVAHDLNNILAPMLMAAGLLKDKLTAARDRDVLAMVETGAQRGASIIQQLLAFSRGIEGSRVSVQLRHLLKEMDHLMRETFPRNLTIEQHVPKDLATVPADATQMHQVMMNLCVNARDAMPQGGKLRVSAENLLLPETPPLPHPDARPGPYVVVTVADTGTGISPDIMQRIFDPFFTTKGLGKGTGLGLSTVSGIVKSHGGFITVYSEAGRGTVFKVYLPAAVEAVEKPKAAPTRPVPTGHGELILVVDDEAPIQQATRLILESHHYRVLTAGNGEEAIRLFVEYSDSVRLVVTDVMMPGMGGQALVRSLHVLRPDLKVIACSGLEQADNDGELVANGIVKFLTKPCAPAVLLKTVHRLLAEKR